MRFLTDALGRRAQRSTPERSGVGNLLSDGEYTYSYNTSNRLTVINKTDTAITYHYNGQGDRIQQTVNGVENNYTLDLNSGLAQVLAYGDETYSYGLDRLG